MLVSLFRKGYKVILFAFLFDLFLFDSKIETICKDKKMKRTIKQKFIFAGAGHQQESEKRSKSSNKRDYSDPG
jgi:hypothetical protein